MAWGPPEQAGLTQKVVWPLRAAARNWHVCLGKSQLKSVLQSTTKTSLPPSWRHLAELLSLSSKRERYHNSSWTVLSTSMFFLFLPWPALTRWSLTRHEEVRDITQGKRVCTTATDDTFSVWGGSSKKDLTCKNWCDFFFFFLNLWVFPPSVLNHLSASLISYAEENPTGCWVWNSAPTQPRPWLGVPGKWERALSWRDLTASDGWRGDLGYIKTVIRKRFINRVKWSAVCQVDRVRQKTGPKSNKRTS